MIIHDINHGEAFFKTSGIGCTVNFDLAISYLPCLVDDFKCKVCESKLKSDIFSCLLGE